MAEAPSFFSAVYALVAQIPPGFVASYGQLARMLGAPRAARQVGWAMRCCPDELPWQRVIREDGTIAGGEYAPLRRAMLEAEGVPFTQDGRVAIDRCRWQPGDSPQAPRNSGRHAGGYRQGARPAAGRNVYEKATFL